MGKQLSSSFDNFYGQWFGPCDLVQFVVYYLMGPSNSSYCSELGSAKDIWLILILQRQPASAAVVQ